MPEYMSSGSAVERFLQCRASIALPHAYHESIYTERGTVIHAFLEACSTMSYEAALDTVPDEYRDACAELDLTGIDAQLSLAAEVAIAYDVERDTARELGRGKGRCYDSVTESEIPLTVDVLGERQVMAGKRGLIVDWKSGWTTRRSIESVVQLDMGALAASRCYGWSLAEVQLIHVHEDFAPWVQRRVLSSWEIGAFRSVLVEAYEDARRIRASMAAGVAPSEFRTGPWCERCPAYQWCPAQTALLRSVISRDLFDGLMRMEPIPRDALASAWRDVHEAQHVLSLVKSKILGAASSGPPIHLGGDRYLGRVVSQGNEQLDGDATFEALAELIEEGCPEIRLPAAPGKGEECAAAATTVEATKAGLESAIKKYVPKRMGAPTMRELLRRLRDRGAATRPWRDTVKEFAAKEGGAISAPPALPSGQPDPTRDD